jgi:hypothetical protein
MAMNTPGVADARAWAEHFGLADRPNARVLLGDDRYKAHQATYDMVPGFYLVDRDGTLLLDATGHHPADSLYADVAPRVAALLGARPGDAVEDGAPAGEVAAPVTLCPVEEHPERRLRAALDPLLEALEARRFADAEAALDALRAKGRVDDRPLTWLEVAWEHLGQEVGPDLMATLDAWVEARPESAWARTVRGRSFVIWAWQARGGGYANTVSEEGWRLFGERLQAARVDLVEAVRRDPRAVDAAAILIKVCMGLGLERDAAEACLEAARRAQPGHLGAHRAMLVYLMPKWHGDEEAMWSFARAAVAAHPDDPAFLLLLDDAHDEMARMEPGHDYLKRHAAELDALHAKVVERYPGHWPSWKRRSLLASQTGARAQEMAYGLKAAEAGDLWWLYAAGKRHLEGSDPHVPRDVRRGLQLLCRSAAAGRREAATLLGEHLERGAHGLTADPAAAAALYRAAAEAGDDDAMAALARCHLAGRGAPRSVPDAIAWLRRAAEVAGRRRSGAERARWFEVQAAELERRAGPRGRRHPDGFDDWYPDDVSPPKGHKYPCDLTALPRDLACLPAAERAFVNHLMSVCLEAARSKLTFFQWLRWYDVPEAAPEAVRLDLQEMRALLAAEPAPAGLEAVRADVVAALELQERFCVQFAARMLVQRARIVGLERDEASRRWSAANRVVFPSIREGKAASARLQAAWAKLEARYGRAWTPAVKDAVFHHLCATDLY